jgi:YesN/AraC family two-component response regulator
VKKLIADGGYDFDIVEAENGVEALELVKKHKPKIIFSDINMPLMNGLELTHKVKEIDKNISVIIFSSDNDFKHAIEAIRLGVADYLPKPIDAQDFKNVMTKIMKQLNLLENIINWKNKSQNEEKSLRSDVERVKAYIYKHYSEQLSVELLASKVFLSSGYMSYIFKKETGVGISQFITTYRMEMAKRLLMDTNMKIVQISSEVGFNNSAYFGKSFKEYYGCSPEQYRRGCVEYEKNA